MANIDAPNGLTPIGTEDGGTYRIEEYQKVVGFGTAIFVGDAVAQAAGAASEDLPILDVTITPGTTSYSGISLNYSALSTRAVHSVVVSPGVIFWVQDNNATDGVTSANLGLNGNLELNAGSTVTKRSGHELNETGLAVTSTFDVKLLGLYNQIGNAFGPNARIECKFNKHRRSFNSVAGI